MKRTKKFAVLIITLFVICIILTACNHTGLPVVGDYDAVYEREIPALPFDEEFKVLQFTDLHLFGSGLPKDKLTVTNMQKTVLELKPDLVIITGDAVDGKNNKATYNKQKALAGMAESLEETGVYWAYVPGNNDGEYLGDNRTVIAFLMQYPHCIVGNTRNVDGAVNYSVDLVAQENGETEVVHRLVFMDSGCKVNGEIHGFYTSQEDWMRGLLAKSPALPVSVFFHIPVKEHQVAYSYGVFASNYPKNNKYPKYTVSETSDSLGKLLLEAEEVKLVSTGHVHSNNFAALYAGKYYHFGLCSGYKATKGIGDKTGASLITIRKGSAAMGIYTFHAYAY